MVFCEIDLKDELPKRKLARLLKKAASQAVAEGDPWKKHHIEKVPAERIIRHLYQPESQTWKLDETIVKIEKEPFTHGAMRYCYRMKKLSPPPQHASNHRFHEGGWTRSSNYVAKAYLIPETTTIDTSDEAKSNVKNDIILQYEASRWSNKFNEKGPPKKIIFIRAYAIEFPDRDGKPLFAVERYIFGSDQYGAGFTKHNTNAGFVDVDLHRLTPQVFSAFSFYASQGNRLVADIQGVGNLFTDPQVLSSDYRFGDGDLGPRGMALFFKSFCHSTLASAVGLPTFPLSRNELKTQEKHEDDDFSMSGDNSSFLDAMKRLNRFEQLDVNRSRRMSVLLVPPKEIVPDSMLDTEKRANLNLAQTRVETKESLRRSFRLVRPKLARTKSEIDEVQTCLSLAKQDFDFSDMKLFLRKESGDLMAKINCSKKIKGKRGSLIIRQVSEPISICNNTELNLGKVHYQLAVLHGMGRFPDVVPAPENVTEESPSHDVYSVLFHLCHAASLRCVPALLSLGRVLAGIGTSVSPLLDAFVPVDFEAAKDMLKRAMDSGLPPYIPKAAAGCILYQIYIDEDSLAREEPNNEEDSDEFCPGEGHSPVPDLVLINLLEDILQYITLSDEELQSNKRYNERVKDSPTFKIGDKIQGNYCMEGNYYSGIVELLSESGDIVTIRYDDDGSTESLSIDNVRMVTPPTATTHILGGPLTDEEAGFGTSDGVVMIEQYQLKADLAELLVKKGENERAAILYDEAANGAIEDGKMKTATEWSLLASSLL